MRVVSKNVIQNNHHSFYNEGVQAIDSGNLKITNLDRLIFTKNGEFTI